MGLCTKYMFIKELAIDCNHMVDNSGRLIALIYRNWGCPERDKLDMLSFGYTKFEGPDCVFYIPLISLSTKIPKAFEVRDGMLHVLSRALCS